jgi:N6-L-threonylcarbamoyladenine synthase
MDALEQFLNENYPERSIVAVGYSKTPRDVEGSYMPCFLSGVATASAISATLGCPKFAFSHQSGHVMAALYSAKRLDLLDSDKPFAAFHVSGGTTEILLIKPNNHGFSVELIGGTADINAGQAIDRTGVLMGMRFPCGREMEATLIGREISPAKTRISVKGLECNLSGLENLAKKMFEETKDRAAVSAYCFDFVADTLLSLTKNLREIYPDIQIIYAGGVMSNKRIGARLAKNDNTYFSSPEFSSDNAAGVALLCRKRFLEND